MTFGWLRSWWVVAGALALTAALTGAFALRGAGSACAAARATSGKATFYTDVGGNCSYPTPPADGLWVALAPAEYDSGAACGGYLDVKGPDGSVRVKVVDQCPPCETGHVDLSKAAFERIADPVLGIVPVTYSTVTSPTTAALSFRIKEGASAYWFAVLVDNTGNALRSVEAKGPGGSWRATHREDYNYWLVDSGIGSGPFSIRVTDVRGRAATATGITLSPGRTQLSGVRLGGGVVVPEKKKLPAKATPKPTPTPTSTPSPSAVPSTVPPTEAVALPATGGDAGLGNRCD